MSFSFMSNSRACISISLIVNWKIGLGNKCPSYYAIQLFRATFVAHHCHHNNTQNPLSPSPYSLHDEQNFHCSCSVKMQEYIFIHSIKKSSYTTKFLRSDLNCFIHEWMRVTRRKQLLNTKATTNNTLPREAGRKTTNKIYTGI